MDPWVIFDADNTLRETESLYDDARRMLTGILALCRIDGFESHIVAGFDEGERCRCRRREPVGQ